MLPTFMPIEYIHFSYQTGKWSGLGWGLCSPSNDYDEKLHFSFSREGKNENQIESGALGCDIM
jgi:hypothetical protein